jgi:hypothetical protein
MVLNSWYILTVNNVEDLSGNEIAPDSQAGFEFSGHSVIFQDEVGPTPGYSGTRDAHIKATSPNSNYGNNIALEADGNIANDISDDKYVLVSWNLSSLDPAAILTSASITLNAFNPSSGHFGCFRLRRAWDEQDVSWNEADNGVSWGSPGALDSGSDHDPTVLCDVTAGSTGPATHPLNANGLTVAQGWVDGSTANHGLLIAAPTNSDGADWHSSEVVNSSLRPRMNLTYTLPDVLPEPPNAPTNLAATTQATADIDVSWTDNASDEDGFRIERSPAGAGTWSQVTSVASNSTAWTDSGVQGGSSYDYRVHAFNTGGASDYSNVDSATASFDCNSDTISPASDTWTMFALPCKPATATPSAIVPLPDGDYGVTWVIYYHENDPPSGGTRGYRLVGLNETMVEGGAFFFFATVAVPSFTISGDHNSGANVPLAAHASNGMFNLIGNPYNGVVEWADTRVVDGASLLTLGQADPGDGPGKLACEDTVNTLTCVMARKMYKWNGANYDVSNGLVPTTGQFDPMDVVWVDGFKPGIELQYGAPGASGMPESFSGTTSSSSTPASRDASVASTGQSAHTACPEGRSTGATPSCPGTQSKSTKLTPDWYIQLIAESDGYADTTNYLGRLADAIDGQDYRDLEEPAPFGSKYLSLVFLNDDFTPVSWGYTTDFRAPGKHHRGTWNFVVRASAEFGEITLNWSAEDWNFKSVFLKDLETGKQHRILPGGSYSFTVNGGERKFSLIVK